MLDVSVVFSDPRLNAGRNPCTVTMDVTKAFRISKQVKIEYRLDKTNIIHVPIGKASFTEEQLRDNFQTLMDAVSKLVPAP